MFEAIWDRIHRHLQQDPAVARFLVQLEASPLRGPAHAALPGDDPLASIAEGMAEGFVDLPAEILYDLALAPAVRLVVGEVNLDSEQQRTLIESCWRAVSSGTRSDRRFESPSSESRTT